MNFKTTILLIVVLAGVGAYLFFTHGGPPPAAQNPNAPAATGVKLTDLAAAEVTRVAIKPANGQATVLEKTGADWQLVEPVAAPADSFAVSSLVSSLTDLRSTGQVAADQKAGAGLDHPPYSVELTGPGGKVTTIAFGNQPPIGEALDCLVNGREKPDIVSASIYTQLQQPASTYRKMNLVNVGAEQIQQIRITRAGGNSISLTKAGDNWQMMSVWQNRSENHVGAVRKMQAKADSSAVADITSSLSGLSAKTFVDEKRPLSDFGLSQPATTVWFSTAAPTTEPAGPATAPTGTTIIIGRPVDVTKEDVYASIDGQIVTIPNLTADTFKKSPNDLRDKTVLDIAPDAVKSISIKADRTPETKALGPNRSPRFDFILERKEESHVAGPPMPTTRSTTAPVSQPSTPESHWDMVSGMRVAEAADAPVDALLQLFHPLTAQKYIEQTATTQPESNYVITIKKVGSGQPEIITITDPGDDKPLIASHGKSTFELDRALLSKINGSFNGK